MKVIWLSDLHFVADGLVEGHDPRLRLSLAIDFINEHHSDAAYCVISGDLVDRATPEDYSALAKQIMRLKPPVLPMVGNHDDRDMVKEAFAVPDTAMLNFVQYAVKATDALIVCLDSLTPDANHGSLCEARLSWLARTLSDTRDRPVVVFQHHPPMHLGLPMQDGDAVRGGDDLLELLAECPQVRQLCLGHVHRPISGAANGIPFATLPAVLYQAPPPVPAWDWTSFEPAKEPPALGVVTIKGWDVQVQNIQFCTYEDGVT